MAESKGIIKNATSNKVAKKDNKSMMADYVKSMKGDIAKALPSMITPERFTRIVMTALNTTPQLAECTPQSFLSAMMCSAQLGLEPNTPLGQAYLIPYKNKGVDEVQFQLGYKGLLQLAYRSGDISVISAHVVYSNDKFTCEYGLEPKLSHIPADKDRGEAIKVYAVFKTKTGGYGFEVMTMDEVKEYANKYSRSANSSYSPWTTNFEEMAKKTVLKKVLKYAPMSTDFVRATSMDESIKQSISEDMSLEPAVVIEAEATVVESEKDTKDSSTEAN